MNKEWVFRFMFVRQMTDAKMERHNEFDKLCDIAKEKIYDIETLQQQVVKMQKKCTLDIACLKKTLQKKIDIETLRNALERSNMLFNFEIDARGLTNNPEDSEENYNFDNLAESRHREYMRIQEKYKSVKRSPPKQKARATSEKDQFFLSSLVKTGNGNVFGGDPLQEVFATDPEVRKMAEVVDGNVFSGGDGSLFGVSGPSFGAEGNVVLPPFPMSGVQRSGQPFLQ